MTEFLVRRGVISALTLLLISLIVFAGVRMIPGDPARVMAGTDCGFDTSAGMGRVAEDVMWSKLGAMVEGARIASQRLCGS